MKNPIKLSQSIAGVAVIFVLAFNAQASEIPGTPSPKAETELEAPRVEDRSAEWHLQNWPVDESHRQYNQDLQQTKNGKHIWRNGKGGIVAEIEIKDSQPFEGLTYIQGASDYRMVMSWKKGKGKLLWSYILKEEKWVIIQDHQRGEQAGADQPATRPEDIEGNSHTRFLRFGDNPLAIHIVKSPEDKEVLFMMIDPGCVQIRVNLVKKEGMIYTYRIVGGEIYMVDWAKKLFAIEGNEFKITTKEVTSKEDGADITHLMITSIANSPTTSEQDADGNPH